MITIILLQYKVNLHIVASIFYMILWKVKEISIYFLQWRNNININRMWNHFVGQIITSLWIFKVISLNAYKCYLITPQNQQKCIHNGHFTQLNWSQCFLKMVWVFNDPMVATNSLLSCHLCTLKLLLPHFKSAHYFPNKCFVLKCHIFKLLTWPWQSQS